MLYTRQIERITEVAINSVHVVDEQNTRPLNIIFSTLSGGGKSAVLLEKFGLVDGVKAFGDVTYQRLVDKWLDKAYKGEVLTWIFAEFNKIISRKLSTARNTVGLIDEVCEEGCPSIDLPYFSRVWNPPVRANVIIGLTPTFLKKNLIEWWTFGFMQRFIIVTWSYSDWQEKNIMNYIKKQYHMKEGIYRSKFQDTEIRIPDKFAEKIDKKYTTRIVNDMTDYAESVFHEHNKRFDRKTERELPFRLQMRLQKFLKTLALLNGHTTVGVEDYLEFKDLFRFMNMKYNHP